MKNLISFIITIGLLSSLTYAQNDLGKADDIGRIAIAPMISELSGDIPASAQKILISKMKQIATLNGMAALPDNPMFIMYPSVTVLSKETTPTAPPMQAINIEVSFFIADLASGNVYSETSLELKGVGKTEDRAYMQALKNINYKKGQFKAFVETGQEKIVEYYNSNCDVVLSTAKTLISQNKNDLALLYLLYVPSVSKECYDNAMKLAQTIDPTLTAPAENAESENNDDYDVEEEGDSSSESSGLSVEINRNIVMQYISTKKYGEYTYVKVEFKNTSNDDVDMRVWTGNFRVIDNSGNAYTCSKIKSGDREISGYFDGTVIPEAPIHLELQFNEKISSIRLFELDFDGNKFKIRNIPANTIK